MNYALLQKILILVFYYSLLLEVTFLSDGQSKKKIYFIASGFNKKKFQFAGCLIWAV